jgi:hypothetical protein
MNPDFTKSFEIEYFFEIQQHIKFEIYKFISPQKSDFMGECFTTLSRIVGAKY